MTTLLKYLCLASLIPVLATTTVAVPATSADQNFQAIARLLERADNAFETGALQDAARLYGATVRAYEQFMTAYPEFAPDLVRFRIAYCRNQMTLVRQKLENLKNATPVNSPQEQETGTAARPIALPAEILSIAQAQGGTESLRVRYDRMVIAGDPAAPLLMATILVREGSLIDAREILEQFILDFPDHPAAHYNIAQLILRDTQPDMEKARLHYQRAIDNGARRDTDLEIVLNF
jgi:tetratricopeptide (TPR) repeat protein